MKTNKIHRIQLLSVGLLALSPFSLNANLPLTIGVELDFASEYVFRGFKETSTAVHPAIYIAYAATDTVSLNGSFWAALPARSGEDFNEFDYSLSAGFMLSDQLSFETGATLYYFPRRTAGDEAFDYWEGWILASFAPSADSPLSFSFGYWRSLESIKINTLEAGARIDLPFAPEFGGLRGQFSLMGELGTVFPDDGDQGFSDYQYYGAYVGLRVRLVENLDLNIRTGVTGTFNAST